MYTISILYILLVFLLYFKFSLVNYIGSVKGIVEYRKEVEGMRTVIYYFSGTGNSRKIAQEIAEKLGDTSYVSMSAAMKQDLDSFPERIGLVFPVIMWGIPALVSKFIHHLRKADRDTYFFAVATYGGVLAGSLLQVRNKLKAENLKLSAGFSVLVNRQEPWSEVMNKNLGKIVQTVGKKAMNKIERGSFLDCLLKTGLGSKLTANLIPGLDKNFRTNEQCTGCGTCLRVCPVDNIRLESERPGWQHHCQQCFACFNWCPNQAIRFGKKSDDRYRYKNSCVKLVDMLADRK